MITNINPAQMLWYAMMFNQDRTDSFDAELNMTEYLASFTNPEAVKQVRDGRQNQTVVSDEDFGEQLRKQFGRDLNEEMLAGATRADTIDMTQVEKTEVKRKGSISMDDIKKYTGLPLDDVKYTPRK